MKEHSSFQVCSTMDACSVALFNVPSELLNHALPPDRPANPSLLRMSVAPTPCGAQWTSHGQVMNAQGCLRYRTACGDGDAGPKSGRGPRDRNPRQPLSRSAMEHPQTYEYHEQATLCGIGGVGASSLFVAVRRQRFWFLIVTSCMPKPRVCKTPPCRAIWRPCMCSQINAQLGDPQGPPQERICVQAGRLPGPGLEAAPPRRRTSSTRSRPRISTICRMWRSLQLFCYRMRGPSSERGREGNCV